MLVILWYEHYLMNVTQAMKKTLYLEEHSYLDNLICYSLDLNRPAKPPRNKKKLSETAASVIYLYGCEPVMWCDVNSTSRWCWRRWWWAAERGVTVQSVRAGRRWRHVGWRAAGVQQACSGRATRRRAATASSGPSSTPCDLVLGALVLLYFLTVLVLVYFVLSCIYYVTGKRILCLGREQGS